MPNHSETVNFIWSIANLLRDAFKRSKYPDVILPFTVLRRLDCVLEPRREAVLEAYHQWHGKLENLDPQLRRASGFAFYNTTPFSFERLCADPANLAANLRKYIHGFSENMREVVTRYDFENTIAKLDEHGLLFAVMEKFKAIDLHPDVVGNMEMGTIFEELIRRFNEATDENPGEHFTPREVIQLMVGLLLAPDKKILAQRGIVRTVYDPCCGTGGMLTGAKDAILMGNKEAQIHLYGQELNPETFAVCRSDLYMKSADGLDAENIRFGSVLSRDQHADNRFDYMLANPPYGKEWKMDQTAVEDEAKRGLAGRFGAGLPRISDGQLLFLQHMIARMKAPSQNGSRIAVVLNGSPLFTGDAGSGESEIRRWILENDWLDAIIALPEQLFYNTGIATYIWIVTNRKEEKRRGQVQLIDASGLWSPMRKSLGDKRREITPAHIAEIVAEYTAFAESKRSKIFANTHFGYRKVTIERPLRLNFQASPERLERLETQKAFIGLATSKKKDEAERAAEEAKGRETQQTIRAMLATLPDELYTDRAIFSKQLEHAAKQAGLKLSSAIADAILSALSERDETAEPCRDKNGNPEPDPELRDTESIPLSEAIETYFAREVEKHVPDAWIAPGVTDPKDGQIGKVGYEINFNRYFYTYTPPRPLEEIEADIKALEREIMDLLREVTE